MKRWDYGVQMARPMKVSSFVTKDLDLALIIVNAILTKKNSDCNTERTGYYHTSYGNCDEARRMVIIKGTSPWSYVYTNWNRNPTVFAFARTEYRNGERTFGLGKSLFFGNEVSLFKFLGLFIRCEESRAICSRHYHEPNLSRLFAVIRNPRLRTRVRTIWSSRQ